MTGRAAMLVAMVLGVSAAALPLAVDPSPWFIWNASASVPIGLYAVKPASQLRVNDLVVVRPPEDVAAFLAEGGYLPRGVPLLKHILALARSNRLPSRRARSPSMPSRSARRASATAVAARCPSGRAAASSPRATSSS